jgi:hypothetical protein
LLHRAVGFDRHALANGDILFIVNPLNVGGGTPLHAGTEEGIAIGRQLDEGFGGLAIFAAAGPDPVGVRGCPHELQAAACDGGLGESLVELGLGSAGAG